MVFKTTSKFSKAKVFSVTPIPYICNCNKELWFCVNHFEPCISLTYYCPQCRETHKEIEMNQTVTDSVKWDLLDGNELGSYIDFVIEQREKSVGWHLLQEEVFVDDDADGKPVVTRKKTYVNPDHYHIVKMTITKRGE